MQLNLKSKERKISDSLNGATFTAMDLVYSSRIENAMIYLAPAKFGVGIATILFINVMVLNVKQDSNIDASKSVTNVMVTK